MDTKRIGLIGTLLLGAIALVGAIVLSAKGIPIPAWLTALLTGLAWLAKSPLGGDDEKKDGAP